MLQSNSPLGSMDIYLVGFHPMKDDPSHQTEARRYRRQANEDFAQCALFDGNNKEANLNGIESIISEKLFGTLRADEKQYWHPRNAKILSGQFVGPGLPARVDGRQRRQAAAWKTDACVSLNRDGEAKPGLETVTKNSASTPRKFERAAKIRDLLQNLKWASMP